MSGSDFPRGWTLTDVETTQAASVSLPALVGIQHVLTDLAVALKPINPITPWTHSIQSTVAAASLTVAAVAGIVHVLTGVDCRIVGENAAQTLVGVSTSVGWSAALCLPAGVAGSDEDSFSGQLPAAIGVALSATFAAAPLAGVTQSLTIQGYDSALGVQPADGIVTVTSDGNQLGVNLALSGGLDNQADEVTLGGLTLPGDAAGDLTIAFEVAPPAGWQQSIQAQGYDL